MMIVRKMPILPQSQEQGFLEFHSRREYCGGLLLPRHLRYFLEYHVIEDVLCIGLCRGRKYQGKNELSPFYPHECKSNNESCTRDRMPEVQPPSSGKPHVHKLPCSGQTRKVCLIEMDCEIEMQLIVIVLVNLCFAIQSTSALSGAVVGRSSESRINSFSITPAVSSSCQKTSWYSVVLGASYEKRSEEKGALKTQRSKNTLIAPGRLLAA